MANFKDLKVYQKSYQLALEIHELSLELPQEIQFDLADQIRRASRSIPTNIAEGYGKKSSQKDFCRYLLIAMGSKDEMLVHLDFLKDLKYISSERHTSLVSNYEETGKMLFGLIKSLESGI